MSVQQLESLVDFLEGQPELALGRCSRSKEGRSLSKRLWQECAGILNSVSVDCAQKTGEQWRMFYNEYKHRLLKKIKKEKSERSATGGGARMAINLTPLQERLYSILGHDVGEPMPGVRHNPFIPVENEGGSGTTTSYHDGVNVVPETVTEYNSGLVQIEVIEPSTSTIPTQSEPVGYQACLEPAVSLTSIESTEGQQTEPTGSQTAQQSQQTAPPTGSQTAQQSQQTAPRRRRRRRQQVTETGDHHNYLQSATAELRSMEAASTQATNRLAAAIEALGARLNEPIRFILEEPSQMVQQRRKRILIIDSDSE